MGSRGLSTDKNNIEVELTGFSGYELKHSKEFDEEITLIGPGTKAGEYFRRYWHPIYISSELGDLPVAIKILGEDLVLFKCPCRLWPYASKKGDLYYRWEDYFRSICR